MKILFITLSNIGDCILTLPVLDALKEKYPQASIACLVSPRPKEIFINNPKIDKVIIFNKHSALKENIKLFFSLAKEKFDIIIDLRNSFFGAFLPAKIKTSPFCIIPAKIKHMKDRHLFRAKLYSSHPRESGDLKQIPVSTGMTNMRGDLKCQAFGFFNILDSDKQYVEKLLNEDEINPDKLIIIAPGARSRCKLWDKENFSRLCKMFIQNDWKIILVGDAADQPICGYIQADCGEGVIDLSGKTSLNQLAVLLSKAKFLITNDSAIMHLASYLNVPVAAIFGPTDEKKYGPWPENAVVIKKDIFCRPCEKALCRFGTLACLTSIKPEEVFNQVCHCEEGQRRSNLYSRILIVRTDRIGDVVLSTPVIKALRQKYPQTYISMMVAPYAKDIIEGNPYLDEVIIYDKDGKHKSWLGTLKFAKSLRKKKFDLAIILHPTNRVHLLTFLAGIPERLGYNRKLGFLLTKKIDHKKQEGQKHEAEYNLELLLLLRGASEIFLASLRGRSEATDEAILSNNLFMPLKPKSEEWAKNLFLKEGISPGDKLLAINPGASCPSKLWPVERFAEVAERLAKLHNFEIIILAGAKDAALADKIAGLIKAKAINLAGKTSVSQLASVLKRCALFISNDSGPVHIASAIGTPVISIFGRSQPGLSPKRWGPLGKRDKYLHKYVGCIQCLAHNCHREFACLKAISVEDVLAVAEKILEKETSSPKPPFTP